jgi:N-acetylmuramoyl-L-alanine amidase
LNAWVQVIAADRDWARDGPDRPVPGEVSRVCIESTSPPLSIEVGRPEKLRDGDYVVRLILSGMGLTMAEDEILVADGLVRKLRVRSAPASAVEERTVVDVVLEHPATPSAGQVPGMPFRTEFDFSRDALAELLARRTIAIDPAHGGRDAGFRGPVNLLEKDVVMEIATELAALAARCGAVPIISRQGDSRIDTRGWSLALAAARPDVLVEIHASGEKDPMARSYHAYASRGREDSAQLAQEVAASLTERMGIAFDGVKALDFAAVPICPAVRIEPVCLTHFVDEANFRAPLFRRRIAQAILNGVSRYLSRNGGGAARAS